MQDKKAEKPYLFAKKTPRKVVRGSKLLFSFDGQIFGKATAKSNIKNIPVRNQKRHNRRGKYIYERSIILDSPTVSLLPNTISKKMITKQLGIKFGQVFKYLTENEYNEIINISK